MNFDEAIRSHSQWKQKLNQHLENPDNTLNTLELAQDNLCVLGKWIYGEGKIYQSYPEFEELIKEHRAFHKAAADIVERKNRGENVKSELVLGSTSSFSHHSVKVIALLMKLKQMIYKN